MYRYVILPTLLLASEVMFVLHVVCSDCVRGCCSYTYGWLTSVIVQL
jgi:hypothetical protein